MKKVFFLLFSAVLSFSGFGQSDVDYIDKIQRIDKSDVQYDMCISPDKKLLAIATPSAIKIVDVQSFKIIRIVPVEFENVYLVSFLSTSDKILVVATNKEETLAEIYSLPEKKFIKKTNPIGKSILGKGMAYGIFAKSDNFLVCVTNEKKIFVLDCKTLDLIRTIPFTEGKGVNLENLRISKDESMIAFVRSKVFNGATLLLFDINGNLKFSKQFEGGSNGIYFSDTNELFVSNYITSTTLFDPTLYFSGTVYKIDTRTGSIKDMTGSMSFDARDVVSFHMLYADNFFAFEFPETLMLHFFEERTSKNILSYHLHYGEINFNLKDILVNHRIIQLSKDIYIITVGYENFSYVIDGKNRKLLGYIYHKGNGIAFVSSDGKFTGDNEAIANLQYNVPRMPNIQLAAQVNQFYTPKLFNQILTSSYVPEINVADLSKVIKLTPGLRITSPDSISEQKVGSVNVRYAVKDNGDGIKEVRFYVNGKLLSDDVRGFKAIETTSRNIPIFAGENIIEAVAVSNSGYQSSPDRVVIKYNGAVTTTNLYILGVGIDQYKNSKYNLNYAVADASSIVDYIKSNGVGIFKGIEVKLLTDQQATKINIVAELNRIAQQANETDVFMLYYAGHGVMSEGSPEIAKDYFMALTDVHQMYGNDNLLSEKGLSAGELREFCKNIKAQKQVILLDACQSGAATETFAMRGASEEKAIIQLAQSTGVFLISSTGAEQFATEFAELKHGVFTYALLDGLKGAADGGAKDGKITIKELEAYLNDRIPELTQKYRGSMQFPNTWSRGMDFPIVIVR